MILLIALVASGFLVAMVGGVLIGRLTTAGASLSLKDVIGLILITAFIGALFTLFWLAIPKANEQLIVYMLGQLSGFVSGVVSSHYVNKAGEEKLAEARQETQRRQADSLKSLADAVATGKPADAPTGQAGDPVHVKEDDTDART